MSLINSLKPKKLSIYYKEKQKNVTTEKLELDNDDKSIIRIVDS